MPRIYSSGPDGIGVDLTDEQAQQYYQLGDQASKDAFLRQAAQTPMAPDGGADAEHGLVALRHVPGQPDLVLPDVSVTDSRKSSNLDISVTPLRDGNPLVPGEAMRTRPTTVNPLGLPGNLTAGGALQGRMPTPIDPLDLIEQYESGGRNIPNYRYDSGHTAQGYYQITNSTWRGVAKGAGIDLGLYPNAMSAPKEVQRQVAQYLYDTQGFAPWAPYNPRLANAIAGVGPNYFKSGLRRDPSLGPGLEDGNQEPQQSGVSRDFSWMKNLPASGAPDSSPWTRLLALSSMLQQSKYEPVQVKYDPSLGVAPAGGPRPTTLSSNLGSLPDMPYVTRIGMRKYWEA